VTIVGALDKPYGMARYKVFSKTVSVTGTAEIETGFRAVVAAAVTVESSTTSKMYAAKITGIDGGKITVQVSDYDGTNFNATSSDTVTVHVIAVGY